MKQHTSSEERSDMSTETEFPRPKRQPTATQFNPPQSNKDDSSPPSPLQVFLSLIEDPRVNDSEIEISQDDDLMYDFARPESGAFSQDSGPKLLQWILLNKLDLLTDEIKPSNKNAIHLAISSHNHEFLRHLLDLSEMTKVDIAKALETYDRQKFNCLHAAIDEQLPCVIKMIPKCSETTFTAPDNQGNTPLHLLMKSTEKIWKPTLATNVSFPGLNMSKSEGPTHTDPKVKVKSQEGLRTESPDKFDPEEVLRVMRDGRFKSRAAKQTVKVLTAINEKGQSPYQVCEARMEQHAQVRAKGNQEQNQRGQQRPEQLIRMREQKEKRKEIENERNERLCRLLKDFIFESLTDISHVRRALYGTRGSGNVTHHLSGDSLLIVFMSVKLEKELCLDMSDFNQSSHDFRRFVDQLIKPPTPSASSLLFEETLFYVYLPDLNMFKKKCPHDGIRDLFNWLYDKGVRRIKHLNMCDSTTCPMSEELVDEAILTRFQIEKLDWRKLDIDLDILAGSQQTKALTDLTLYSSGSWSVLHHWSSIEGLPKMEELRKVRIEIMRLSSVHGEDAQKRHTSRVEKYEGRIRDRLKELTWRNVKLEIVPDAEWNFPVNEFRDVLDPFVPNLKFVEQLKICHSFLKRLPFEKGKSQTTTDYANAFSQLNDKKKGAIKVAIIDNGADNIRTSVKDNIDKGVSFVSADSDTRNRLLPWWMVADPHGTQMASLIKQANPFCRLYIARVGKGRKDILPENAAKAVEWAIEQKVDVISISWITRKNDPSLRAAIAQAVEKNVSVFCSTADQGIYSGESFPAEYPGAMRVAATDKYGHMRPVSEAGVSILVPGEDVVADGPSYMSKYMNDGVTVSGSSVATALASGIASLALLLLKLFNQEILGEVDNFIKENGIERVFKKMKSENTGIQLSSLFPDDTRQLPRVWKLSNFQMSEK